MCCRFSFVEGITSGTEDGTDSLPHLTNAKPDPDGPASKLAAGKEGAAGECMGSTRGLLQLGLLRVLVLQRHRLYVKENHSPNFGCPLTHAPWC